MLKILLVFTGGTIGSISLNGTINTSNKQGYKLLDCFQQSYPEKKDIQFKTIQPVELLSENLHPSVWHTLISAIEKENISQYDGVIVTHGTDTLAFTATALSLYFNEIKIPLLLVSSDYPLDQPQANGLAHFNCAVEFIKQRNDAGVFVPYKNYNSCLLVHLGSRIASCLQLSSDFISVQSKAYLSFNEDVFHQENTIQGAERVGLQLNANFKTRILLIKPYPGLEYSHINLDQVDVVIHDLYHSGTACSTEQWGKHNSLLSFIQICNEKKIMVYLAPAMKTVEMYESTRLLLEQGAKLIWNMSLESAYVKLLLAYGNYSNQASIDEFLQSNIAFEIIDDA